MDTGSYMANQMDDMITGGFYLQEQLFDELHSDMEGYIKEKGYTWTADEIIKEYRELYLKSFYVSHTCKEIIKHFEERLSKLFN